MDQPNTSRFLSIYPSMDDEEYNADTFITKIKKFFLCNKKNRSRHVDGNESSSDLKNGNRETKSDVSYRQYIGIIVLSVTFLCCFTGFIIMWFTDIYLSSILEQMTIKEGNEIYKAWRSPPIRPLICAHVFNYTNVDRFHLGLDKKLVLDEVGPYCYRETLLKTNVTFNNDGTVTYGDLRTHKFEPSYSNGSQDDILIVPNIPLIGAVARTKDMPDILRMLVNTVLKSHGKRATVRVKAHKFFFGYDDSLFEVFAGLSKFLHKDIPIEKFGVLAMRAAETKETTTVRTGSHDLDRIGVVTHLNGETMLTAWLNDSCNRIDGSDGAFFPRHLINKTNTLFLFHKALCRRLPLVYQEDIEFQDGVMAMRFHVPPNVHDTEGTCYCTEKCSPKGVFDVSPCSEGFPMMTSFPHFMNGDSHLTEYIEGLHPDPKKHDFYIDIQPILGFTLGTVSRLQINIQIRKADGDRILEEFPNNMILPVFWLEVTADKLPEDLFILIYHSSFTVEVVQFCLKWITLISALIIGMALIQCVSSVLKHKRKSEKQSIKNYGQNNIVMKATEKQSHESTSHNIVVMRMTTV